MAMADAQFLHAQKQARGEEAYQGKLLEARQNDYKDQFVLVNDPKMFEFKRLSGARAFQNIIEPMADQFLFMSSTVLDKDGFCRDLGIDPDDAAFLSLQSEFDVQNRPVYYMPQHKMNFKWRESESGKQAMLDAVSKLLELHDGESGIIHTGNFKIAEWLVDNLNPRAHRSMPVGR